MLKSIQNLIQNLTEGTDDQPADRQRGLQVATAALLAEVARADHREQVEESELIFELLRKHFDLDAEQAEALQTEGYEEAEQAVSLQEFTRLLHETLTVEEKFELVKMLWEVAFADEELDRYEDHLVRKIADLLYVSHKDQIRLRNSVRDH